MSIIIIIILLLFLLLLCITIIIISTVDDFEGAVEGVRATYLALLPDAQMPELLQTMRHTRPYW